MNILVSALGANPDIIEESLALFNYSAKSDLYASNEEVEILRNNIERVQEVWLIATNQPSSLASNGVYRNSTEENYDYIKRHCGNYEVRFRIFIIKGVSDVNSASDAKAFHDLTLRVVSNAKQYVGKNGKLYLSLACGRKTMSTDMQDAAYCFGCDQLIHVLGDNVENAQPILLGSVPQNESIVVSNVEFETSEILYCEPQVSFLNDVERAKQEASHFFTSYYLNETETRSNFHILYTLPPSKIEQLKNEKVGVDKRKKTAELKWLRQLPKTDLHCHLGGVLWPEDILSVAADNEIHEKELADFPPSYKEWRELELPKTHLELSQIKEYCKSYSEKLNVSKSAILSPLIRSLSFSGKDEVTQLVYGKYPDELSFCGIGIDAYEQMGDVQGSSLLDDLNSISKAIDRFLNRCIKENVKYVEIRCSPLNYAKTCGVSASYLVLYICEILKKVSKSIQSSLIFIVSRHREDMTKEYVELVKALKGNDLFEEFFRGFDLAGNESKNSPEKMRESFLDIMKDCYNITIHAGEDQPVENIWQAVYHLNAERIGHGLTLEDNEELLNKFLQRGIGVEMCPSSNYQIVGFRDNYYPKETAHRKVYPLKGYLDKELLVSVNTDDPGISLTDMTHELHKAARMTEGGLSKWDILQLICNGFRTAFYPYEKKKGLIRTAEACLGDLIKKNAL